MRTVVDVVIIGSGATGVSAAFHLARLRGPRAIVVEKGPIGSGMTKRSGGLVRALYPLEVEARLALATLRDLQNWKDLVGGDCGFVETGLVRVVNGESDARRLREQVAMLRRVGVNAEVLSGEALKELQPPVAVDDVSLAAYEPEAGYMDPIAMTRSLAARSKELGAVFQTGTFARRVLVERNRVTGVETNNGIVECLNVVIAAGPWSDRLLKPLGMAIGIRPEWSELAFFERPPELKSGHAAFMDSVTGAFFRPHSYGLTVGGLNGWKPDLDINPDQFPEVVEPEFVAEVQRRLAHRIPGMANARYMRGHTGVYDMTPDGHAVVDHVPGIYGLFVAAGFNGAGSALAPEVGACIADLVTEGETTKVDLSALRFSRFSTPIEPGATPDHA